jgi:hypothetical protein
MPRANFFIKYPCKGTILGLMAQESLPGFHVGTDITPLSDIEYL